MPQPPIAGPAQQVLRLSAVAVALVVLMGTVPRNLRAAPYTQEQAAAGRERYVTDCAVCHGVELGGAEGGNALLGAAFLRRWQGRPVGELIALTRDSMPVSAPGSLSASEAADLVAYLLNRNGFAPGERSLMLTETNPLGEPSLTAPAPIAKQARPTVWVNWAHHRGTPGALNYSPLDVINRDNAHRLKIAWRWKSDNFGSRPWPNLQTTPLMIDGVLYATAGQRRAVVAIDAASGETLWMYRRDEGERGKRAPRKGPGRGVAYWHAQDDERIIYVTPGFQLIALDAETGQPVSTFGDNGVVDLKLALDPSLNPETAPIGSSSPPLIAGDLIVVGAAFPGVPRSPAMPAGDVMAFDVRTGEHRWTFHTVPKPGEAGAETWENDSASYTGNTGVWAPMSVDVERELLFLPVEAATSDFYGGHRPGDNLFSQSLVCLELGTGRRRWHFQTVRHGIWDYDLPAPPVLLDVQLDEQKIPAVIQVTKQGFVFAFDRRDGTPLWPIEDVAVPPSTVPGETAAPTQPRPTWPAPFARQGVTADSLNQLTPAIHAEARRLVRRYVTGPLYTPPSLITEEQFGTLMAPSALGGGNWQGAVADPETGLLYVSAVNSIGVGGLRSSSRSKVRYVLGTQAPPRPFGLPLAHPPWGTITAIDMNSGEQLWQIANGDTPASIKNHPKLQGVDLPRTGHNERAGLLVTRSLLFAGEGAGLYIVRGGGTRFRAHDKKTGAIVADIDLGLRQSGIPMTYAIDGQQFIVVAAGARNRAGELIALTLGDG
ncbi:MAG: PQQ-binding-like beta-propeller repeat protein [Pseudomonadota bacterium]